MKVLILFVFAIVAETSALRCRPVIDDQEIICSEVDNMVYTKCYAVEECQPTCTRESYWPCVKICKPGCVCKEGYVKDENFRCIRKEECPSQPFCDPELHLEYNECEADINVQRTCMTTPALPDGYECTPGCVCQEGYVRDKDWNCVLPEDCPRYNDEICVLPQETGPCRGAFPRWGYDSEEGVCTEFSYGGCEGNDNRFMTEEQCNTICNNVPIDPAICLLPQETGPCRAAMPRWGYNASIGVCDTFTYGGCAGNGNRFLTEERCNAACANVPFDSAICGLPIVPGPCRGSIQSWGYNPETGCCTEFIYGGCQGNGNRFNSEEECNASCADYEPFDPASCFLLQESGPCEAYMPSWGYDAESGCCTEFIYGGCQGNANRFSTEEACNAACGH